MLACKDSVIASFKAGRIDKVTARAQYDACKAG